MGRAQDYSWIAYNHHRASLRMLDFLFPHCVMFSGLSHYHTPVVETREVFRPLLAHQFLDVPQLHPSNRSRRYRSFRYAPYSLASTEAHSRRRTSISSESSSSSSDSSSTCSDFLAKYRREPSLPRPNLDSNRSEEPVRESSQDKRREEGGTDPKSLKHVQFGNVGSTSRAPVTTTPNDRLDQQGPPTEEPPSGESSSPPPRFTRSSSRLATTGSESPQNASPVRAPSDAEDTTESSQKLPLKGPPTSGVARLYIDPTSGKVAEPDGEAGRPGRGGYNLEATLIADGWSYKQFKNMKVGDNTMQ